MYEEKLKQLGLTSGEARAYTALLSLDSSTVGPIVKKSKIAYSKIYEVLERLIEKGLVSFTIRDKTKYFQALEPNRLTEYLEKQEAKIKKSKETLNEILPSLNQISLEDSKRQESEIFIGEKGIKTAYEILLKRMPKNSSILFFYIHSPEYDEKIYDFYYGMGKFMERVKPYYRENKIKWKGLINTENLGHKVSEKLLKHLEIKKVNFPLPGIIDIGFDTTLITSWTDKPIGILIKSKQIADNFRNYFESVWKISK